MRLRFYNCYRPDYLKKGYIELDTLSKDIYHFRSGPSRTRVQNINDFIEVRQTPTGSRHVVNVHSILQEIKHRHRINYEILGRKDFNKEDHYRDLFKSRTRILSPRVRNYHRKNTVAEIMKSRKGYVYMLNTIAVMENGTIEYFVYGTKNCIHFLSHVLRRGRKFIQELYESKDANGLRGEGRESRILEKFKQIAPFQGQWGREVEIGGKTIVKLKKMSGNDLSPSAERYFRGNYSLRIDAVCEVEKEYPIWHNAQGKELLPDKRTAVKNLVWVLEVKEKLNHKAIGQAATYRDLYVREHRDKRVKAGIVCSKVNPLYIGTCISLKIQIFDINKSTPSVLKPELVVPWYWDSGLDN